MTITISIKEPVSQETDIIGLKEAIASLIEQHDLTVVGIGFEDRHEPAWKQAFMNTFLGGK